MDAGEASPGVHRSVSQPRWPYFGRLQRRLVFCGLAIWVGAALPWVVIRPIIFWARASALAVAWMLWAGLMTLGAGIARFRLLIVASAFAGGGTAVYLAGWQTLRLLRLCDFGDLAALRCFPGPGLLLGFAAGAFAMWQGAHLIGRRR